MEIWRKIRTFPDYEISNLGRVRKISTNEFLYIQYANGGDSAFVTLKYKGKQYGRSLGKLLKQSFNN